MSIFLWAFGLWTANMIIGAGVLAAIDDEQESLFHWYCECPLKVIGPPIILTLWPVLAFFWLRMRLGEGSQR